MGNSPLDFVCVPCSSQQEAILSNTPSFYSCVMLAKGVTSAGQFIERALSSIREFMEADGKKFAYRKYIAPSIAAGGFAKSILGTDGSG